MLPPGPCHSQPEKENQNETISHVPIILAALVAVICALGSDVATATAHGTNGKIAFRRYFTPCVANVIPGLAALA